MRTVFVEWERTIRVGSHATVRDLRQQLAECKVAALHSDYVPSSPRASRERNAPFSLLDMTVDTHE